MRVDLSEAVERFESWRGSRKNVKQKIPDELWSIACRLSLKHGSSQVAKLLRLNHVELRRRSGLAPSKESVNSRSTPAALKVTPLIIQDSKRVPSYEVGGEGPVIAEFVSTNGLRVRLFSGVSSDIVKVLLSQVLEAI